MNFTKQQVDLINLNLRWSFICAMFSDPYDAIEAYEDTDNYHEGNMKDFRNAKKKYEETYNEHLLIDNNYSMTWGTNAYGMWNSLDEVLS